MTAYSQLEQLMNAQGRKQRWLAERLGVHESEISRYLSGERQMPDVLMEKAALVLGVPVEWLRADDREPAVSQ